MPGDQWEVSRVLGRDRTLSNMVAQGEGEGEPQLGHQHLHRDSSGGPEYQIHAKNTAAKVSGINSGFFFTDFRKTQGKLNSRFFSKLKIFF